jgi:uncharacterized protein RhaS with RHS repeats
MKSDSRQLRRLRWYWAGWGRYTQADPIGFDSGDTNWYAYAGCNPITFADPLGLVIRNPMDIYRDFRDRRRACAGQVPWVEMRHCVFSCRMALDYGSWLTLGAGVVNEAQGFVMHDLRMPGSQTARPNAVGFPAGRFDQQGTRLRVRGSREGQPGVHDVRDVLPRQHL